MGAYGISPRTVQSSYMGRADVGTLVWMPPPLPSSPYQTLSLQHTVTYQAFREITNFVRNNGDDCNKFCTNTAHAARKAKKAPSPPRQPRHNISENARLYAPKPLLQKNPHCFVLFPIHHANIWRMYKKANLSERRKKSTSQPTLPIGTGCLKLNAASSPMFSHSLLPLDEGLFKG